MAKAKKNIDLDVTPAQQEKKNKYEFEFPYWSNKEAKHMIVTINYPNGTRATASIQAVSYTHLTLPTNREV